MKVDNQVLLEHYLHEQKRYICKEFSEEMSTCIISTTIHKILRHSKDYNWMLFAVPGTDQRSVIVIQKSHRSIPELWVRWNYKSYRKAFTNFLNFYYFMSLEKIPSAYQVDHLQSKGRFKPEHKDYFVRLALLDRRVNASHGAGFEKSFNATESLRELSGGIHMDWMAFLKIYGVTLPSKRAPKTKWMKWAHETALLMEKDGIDIYQLAYHGILSVLQLGFTGFYSGSADAGPYVVSLK